MDSNLRKNLKRFAFVIHPLNARQAAKKYPVMRYLPDGVIESLLKLKKPLVVSHITGIRSLTGAEAEGWFIGCPLTPRQMMGRVPLDKVYERIIHCTHIAKDLGADIIGLGAFTSVVGDGGVTIAKHSPIAVTTGNSYTVATAIEGTLKACNILEIDKSASTLAVVGATGSIGRTCASMLAPSFKNTLLIGRDRSRTEQLTKDIVRSSSSVQFDELATADVIISVTSSETEVIMPERLKRGCVVCDVARPRDVSIRVAKERPDVLVIEGGVVSIPGEVNFNFDFGFPAKTAYACMCETIMLALEGRIENFTLGKDVTIEQVEESQQMAQKHGFSLAGFRSFERPVDEKTIDQVRKARGKIIAAHA